MTQVHQVAIVTPLIVGGGAVLCTILIHGLAVGATVNFFRHEARLGRAGMRYLIDLTIVMLVMSFAFMAHLYRFSSANPDLRLDEYLSG